MPSREWKEVLERYITSAGSVGVIGLGNRYMGDDAAGVIAIDLLKEPLSGKDVSLIEAGRNLTTHLGDMQSSGADSFIFIDAAELRLEPGQIATADASEIVEVGLSTHENNLTLAMSYLKGTMEAPNFLFVAIQFASMDMTEENVIDDRVRVAVNSIVDELVKLLTK